jgi:hypothetical protein
VLPTIDTLTLAAVASNKRAIQLLNIQTNEKVESIGFYNSKTAPGNVV